MSTSALAPLTAPGARPAVERGPFTAIRPLRRATLPDSRTDRLYFAQVREDPMLELEALRPAMRGTIAIIGSGGCTALSLVAAGASDVIAVDANQAQNHLIELKAAAVAALGAAGALAFLGGSPCAASARRAAWKRLRFALGGPARAYWDARGAQVGRGVLGAGVTERFIAVLALAVRLGIHPHRRIERLFHCRTLDEQRAFYDREWNTRRWRLLFRVVLNRWVFDRTYDPAFFANVQNPSFSEHFRLLAEHAIADVPVAGNYFLRHMLTGRYPTHVEGGVPPYLSETGSRTLLEERHRLSLVDATLTGWLRTRPDRSIAGFAISNIAEWLTGAELDDLLAEIVRTAEPGACLCFRNFVGWTEVPVRWRSAIVEDRAAGDALMPRDRSVVQRRFALCRTTGDRR